MGCLQCGSQTVKDLIELHLAVMHSHILFLPLHFSCLALFLLYLALIFAASLVISYKKKKEKKKDHPGLIFKKKARTTKNQVGLALRQIASNFRIRALTNEKKLARREFDYESAERSAANELATPPIFTRLRSH